MVLFSIRCDEASLSHTLTPVGSLTPWHITPFHHTVGNDGGHNYVGSTRSTGICWSRLAGR